MSDPNDLNRRIIEEFRANGGKVGGFLKGMPVLLLHTTGAKSGLERTNPLAYQQVGDAVAVFGSKGGAPTNPDWYHNLVAHPKASIEIGTTRYPVIARVATGPERERIWNAQKAKYPTFAEYEAKAGRPIPVVVLEKT